jgi:hypothetical protein
MKIAQLNMIWIETKLNSTEFNQIEFNHFNSSCMQWKSFNIFIQIKQFSHN